MAKGNLFRLTIGAGVVLLTGCAQLPPAYSLERMQLEAKQQSAKDCYRQASREYPNVPAGDVLRACRRTYGLDGPATPQPIGNSL